MITIRQATTDLEIAAVQELIREFTSWAISLEEGSEKAPTFDDLEAELATIPGPYSPPTGCLLLASADGTPAGCIALRPLDSETAELKRMYVRPAFRGQRIGAQLVEALLQRARAAGYRQVILDSHQTMTAAHKVYYAAGFQQVEGPADFPEDIRHYVVFMTLELIS